MGGDLRSNRNELFKLFKAAWTEVPDIQGLDIPGPYPEVFTFNDADSMPENPTGKPWARATMQTTDSVTRGISGKRTVHSGLFIVQCFVRRTGDKGKADNQVQLIAEHLATAFKRHRGNVLLTNTGPIERPVNNGYAQCDVRSAFEWDQFNR